MTALKVPVMLGLFLLTVASIYCEEPVLRFDEQGGWLWADKDGEIFFHRQGVSVEKAESWHLSFSGEQFSVNHQNARVQSGAFFFGGGAQGSRGGINADLGFYNHGNMDLLWDRQHFENKGGEAFSLSLSLPVYFNHNELIFSFTNAAASWQDGSFYWFLGRPRLDNFRLGGLSFVFGERQSIELEGLFLDGGILSPEGVSLFDFSLRGLHASYGFQKDFHPLSFGGNFGILYGEARFEGSLTTSNQHYTLFPYLVYETSGQIGAFAGYGMVNLAYRARFFSLAAQIGVLQIFYSNCGANVYYKQKRLFGGKETRYAFTPIDLGRLGCAFIGIDAALLLPGPKAKPVFTVGIKKLFFIPWNYQQMLSAPDSPDSPGGSGNESQGTAPAPAISEDLLKSALLSGLSLYLSFSY
jgi:hypothetical protein